MSSSSFIFGVILPTSSEAKILNFNLSSRFCKCLLSVVVSPPGCIVATVLVVAVAMLLTLLETVALLPIVLGKLLVVAVVKTGTLVEVAAVSAAVSTLVTVVVVSASVASVAVLGPGVDVVGVAAAHADALVLGADAGL